MSEENKTSTPEKQDVKAAGEAEKKHEEKKEDKRKVVGTSAKLFPELNKEDKEDALPSKEGKAKEPEKEVKTEETEYLDVKDFGKKKVKTKIEGIEGDVSLEQLIKGYQTDQYLTRKGQVIATEFKRLQDTKALEEMNKNKSLPDKTEEPLTDEDDEFYSKFIKPNIVKLEKEHKKEIDTLTATIKKMEMVMAPYEYENNVNVVANVLKEQGFPDFKEYRIKVEEFIMSQPIERQPEYDSMGAYIQVYKDIKLKELLEKKTETPIKREVKIPKIEGGGGTPSASNVDSWNVKYNEAFKRAKETGEWGEVISLKDEAKRLNTA